MIKRFIEDDFKELITEFPAVAIVGPRQVGKTTLVKQLQSVLNKKIIYLDLENPRDENKLQDPVLFFENHLNDCVVLDEIQRRRDLFPILRAVIDLKREAGRFIL